MALNEEYIKKLKCYLEYIPKRMYQMTQKVEFVGFVTTDRLTFTEAKAHEKVSFAEGTRWGKKWEYGWFFTEITIPESCRGQQVMFRAELGECLLFVDGKVYGSIDREHPMVLLTKCAKGGERYQIAMEVYAGHSGLDGIPSTANVLPQFRVMIPEENIQEFPENVTQKTMKNGEICIFHEEVFQLWMDINTLYELRNNLDANSLRVANIDKGLKQVCHILDLEATFDEFMVGVANARKILQALLACRNSESAPSMYAIGNSHLDLEWLWTKEETRRKAARTLGNQLKMLEEYDDYIYIQSQPWILETVKNEYPDLYEEVKEAVKNGRIVVEGGMWVQADTNIPSGESFIRQFIFGKKFIREEFGKESEIFWLPDSFGCSASLPQIMKGCGIKYFMNAKVQWLYNGGDKVPNSTFMWKGIDGTEILSHLTVHYAAPLHPALVIRKWNENQNKEDVPMKLLPYGHGDGGGGATRVHLEYLQREKDLEGMPKVVSTSPNEFYRHIENECDVKARYVGELYYAAHRGSYTSQANTKKLNRKSEWMLREAEMWSALTEKNSAVKEKTDLLWKDVLFNQFHDVLPGTSLKEAHERAEDSYQKVIEKAREITDDILDRTANKSPDSLTIFNSLSWDRKIFVKLPEDYNAACDGDGNYVETQRVGDGVFASLDVPSCGYNTYRMCHVVNDSVIEDASTGDGEEFYLENNLIKVKFNKFGEIVSIVDKETGMEFLNGYSNQLRMYKDTPMMCDAWDIDSFYEEEEVPLSPNVEMTIECRGDLLSSLIIKKKINRSEITQRVMLRRDSRRIDFETDVDWNETHKLLKVDFNTNIHTDELISEIQFGYIKRPNHKSRQYDADRFEVCQQKWSALAEGKRGIAILNDCKYGISADGERMSLTLLKAAMAPALNADKGIHHFTYSVMPFTENISDSNVVQEAYELNCPAITKAGNAGIHSFLQISNKNIIADTIKYAEDESGDIIIRLYESQNSYTNCKLDFGFDVKEVYLANMLEENQERLEVENNAVTCALKAFEVVTLRVRV